MRRLNLTPRLIVFCYLISIASMQAQSVSRNPFYDSLEIQASAIFGEGFHLVLYNTQGEVVFEHQIQRVTKNEEIVLSLDSIPNGIFILSLLKPTTWMRKVISEGFTQNVSVIIHVSVEPSSNSELVVYPNPVYGRELTVAWAKGLEETHIQIFDLSGKMVHNQIIETSVFTPEKKIDISQLPNSTYLIKVQAAEQTLVKQFVKACE